MTEEELKSFEPFWDKWYIVEKLGSGSYGDVYKIKREEYGEIYYAALKIISFPRDKSELEEITFSCGGTLEGAKTHYDNMVKDIITEIRLMERLKGKTNIVSYEDHDIIPKKNGMPGYDIFIRMELLEDLRTKIMKNPAFVQENSNIIKIGEDIAEALKICHSQNIIHRDIKPGNIFCSLDEDYKLGDFGIARSISENQQTMSLKGTYDYMAPEIYRHQHYDFRADIYSLGMVLYHLSNGLKGPFLKVENQIPTNSEKEEALTRRMSGESLPAPRFAAPPLAEVILKACASHPDERFQSIQEFYDALVKLKKQIPDVEKVNSYIPKEAVPSIPDEKISVNDKMDQTVSIIGNEGCLEEFAEKSTDEKENRTVSISNSVMEDDRTIPMVAPVVKTQNVNKTDEKENIQRKEIQRNEIQRNEIQRNEIQRNENNRDVVKKRVLICAAAILGIVVVGGVAAFVSSQQSERTSNEQQKNTAEMQVKVDEFVEETETQEPESEIIIPVEPILQQEIIVRENKESEPNQVKIGTKFEKMTIEGKFCSPDEEEVLVEGKLELLDKGKLKKSGDYEWHFIPDDTEAYMEISGTVHITALCTEMITGVEAVEKIEDKASLTEVDLSGCGLEDLSILEGAVNLRALNAERNNLKDISALKDCVKLEFVSFYQNPELKDISVFKKLKLKNVYNLIVDETSVSSEDREKLKKWCKE